MGMIKIDIPTNVLSLFEFVRAFGEGIDICDKDWDWGIYFECPASWEECTDAYAACMLFFALNLECPKLRLNGFTSCNVADFIVNNLLIFKKFFNEQNREGYRPMDYENSDDANSDDGFFEAYMEGFESLIAGNYCEDDYAELLQMFNVTAWKKEDNNNDN